MQVKDITSGLDVKSAIISTQTEKFIKSIESALLGSQLSPNGSYTFAVQQPILSDEAIQETRETYQEKWGYVYIGKSGEEIYTVILEVEPRESA